MNRGRRRRRGRDPDRPLNSHAEGCRGREKKRKDKRERKREREGDAHTRAYTQFTWRLQKHFSRSLHSAGVDLMNGNVGIIVFTRGTHGCLSRHTWRGNIPFIKRSARSSHRRIHPTVRPTRMHMHTQTHRRGRVHDPLPTARGLTPVTYSEFRCRAEGWSRPSPR